jgi:hypothetical protein
MKKHLQESLQQRIAEMEGIAKTSSVSAEFRSWRSATETMLKELFGEDSGEVMDFNAIYFTPVFLSCRMDDGAFEEAFRGGLEEAKRFLSGLCQTGRPEAVRR